jgi:hypothetical protein
MTKPLEDCWAKLNRAKEHVNLLDDEIRGWEILNAGTIPVTVWREFDADTNCFIFGVQGIPQLPKRWALILGDAITNFRASLDYLAMVLVEYGTTPNLPAKHIDKVYFPIVLDSKDFKSALLVSSCGVRDEHLAIIERAQPYHRRIAPHLHPLAILADLARQDKHRKLQRALSRAVLCSHRVTRQAHFGVKKMEWSSHRLFDPTQEKAEIVRMYGVTDGLGQPDMDMTFDLTYGVELDNGLNVGGALAEIGAAILDLISEIEPLL